MHVVPVNEGDGDSGLAGAPGATRAVQVGVVVIRDGVVDHVGHVVDVDAASCDICGDEDVFFASFERGHGALALLLVEVAVNGGSVEAAVVEFFDQFGGGTLGAGEDDGLAAPFRLQDAGDNLVFVERVGTVDDVLDVGLGEALVGVGGANVNGLVHEATSEGHDRAGHRCGEQHGVTRGRGLGEELFDVGEEAEVEHLVCLIQNHDGDVFETQQALGGEVKEAPGSTNDDLRASLELFNLAFVGFSAVDGSNLGGAVGGGEGQVFGNLNAEFAGRDDDERFDAGRGVGAERLEKGQAETERLTGTGLGLADDVLAGESHRDGLLLDGEWFDDAFGGECINHVLINIKFSESHVK